MDLLLLSAASVVAATAASPEEASAPRAPLAIAATARRSAGGVVATATVSVRIISESARVGRDLPPPLFRSPRATMVEAADGSSAPALIYDFE